MRSMILLVSRLPGGHCLRAGDRKSSVTNGRQSAGRQALPGDWCRQDAAIVDWVSYPGASLWTTLYVNTAIFNLILSGMRN